MSNKRLNDPDQYLDDILEQIARVHEVDLSNKSVFKRKIRALPRLIKIKNKKLLKPDKYLVDITLIHTDGKIRLLKSNKEKYPMGVVIENMYMIDDYSYVLMIKEINVNGKTKEYAGFFFDEVEWQLKHKKEKQPS